MHRAENLNQILIFILWYFLKYSLGKNFVKLREEIEWGYTIPYMITCILDLHPRAGMKLRNSEEKDEYLSFYEKLTSEANV